MSYLNSLFTCIFCLLSLYESYIIRYICVILIVYNYQSTLLMLAFILFCKILKLFYTYWVIFLPKYLVHKPSLHINYEHVQLLIRNSDLGGGFNKQKFIFSVE